TVGNLNVVMVGWADTATHTITVTDSKGNAYALAVGPTVFAGSQPLAHSIYYAKNIAAATAGSNTVTVSFSPAVQFPAVRIAEYTGIDPTAPLDVTAFGTGTGSTSSTAAVTTTNANDLLVAGNMVETSTRAAGTGFTSRLVTSPDGDILEDRIV